jgi:DNA-binding PadR family transcriptional regulator
MLYARETEKSGGRVNYIYIERERELYKGKMGRGEERPEKQSYRLAPSGRNHLTYTLARLRKRTRAVQAVDSRQGYRLCHHNRNSQANL